MMPDEKKHWSETKKNIYIGVGLEQFAMVDRRLGDNFQHGNLKYQLTD